MIPDCFYWHFFEFYGKMIFFLNQKGYKTELSSYPVEAKTKIQDFEGD